MPNGPLKVTQVGHPFNPIGNGRVTRIYFSSLRAARVDVLVRDAYGLQEPEMAQAREMLPCMTKEFGAINIFNLNGDEIEPVLKHLGGMPKGFNIIAPAWELPRFPAEWAEQVNRFDEAWCESAFIQQSVAAAARIPVLHMRLATEIKLEFFIGRRKFGIPEDSYTFLNFFDFRSYIQRKNPGAVLECFRRVIARRPWAKTNLVIKLHGAEAAPEAYQEFLAAVDSLAGRVVVINATLREAEVHNLIRACDAFVSLHRAEGYGLGLAEAMYLGKPVIGTGYSGNMDFMTPKNSYPVDYTLIPVPEGAYPHAEDQSWADPDLEDATRKMLKLVDDPTSGRALGAIASRDMRVNFSYRAAGLGYAARLAEITGMKKAA
jgi:glycosyltransferase involved in cell wall biosynthesis